MSSMRNLLLAGTTTTSPFCRTSPTPNSMVKRLLAPRILAHLATWPAAADDASRARWASHLEGVLRILDETVEDQDRRTIVRECERRFIGATSDPLALTWLRGMFRFDSERGAQVLEECLTQHHEHDRPALAINAIGSLVGDHGGALSEISNPSTRVAALCRLVRCAYRYIRPVDDRRREGPYKPDTRDRAEKARMFLMSALQETPGPDAYRALLELAADPLFADMSDRLRLSARQRAALDAEFSALTPADLVVLEERFETPPHDRDGLYTVMTDRMDDLAHDLANDDFTDRRTLRTIDNESEMQRTLAGRIRDRSSPENSSGGGGRDISR